MYLRNIQKERSRTWQSDYLTGPFFIISLHVSFHTVNCLQIPVWWFLAVTQDKGEGLGEGGAVCIFGFDDDRLRFLHTDEGLFLYQFRAVVIHIQQPHSYWALWRLLWVSFRRKPKGKTNIYLSKGQVLNAKSALVLLSYWIYIYTMAFVLSTHFTV